MADEWKEALPEAIRNAPVIKDSTSVESMAEQLVNAQKLIGDSIRIPGAEAGADAVKEFTEKLLGVDGVVKTPGAEAKPEEVAAFYNKLGRPEKPDGYTVKAVEGDSQFEQIRATVHKLGLSDKQFADYYAERAGFVKNLQTEGTAQMVKWADQLKEKYGTGYEEVVSRAGDILEKLAEPELMEQLKTTGLINSPALVNMMSKLADELDDDTVSSLFKGKAPAPVQHKGTAQAQVDEIMANKEHAYHDRLAPTHMEAVEQVQRLYKVITSAEDQER
jgi:hypothetical protein